VAVNLLLARTDDRVAASAAARAEALGFLQKPDAHLESEILRGEGADRAEVHRVEGVIVVERFPGIMRERVVTAAIDETERVVPDDVPREPNTARTENAAFIIEHDARAETDGFGLVHLGLDEAAGGLAVVHRVFLQLAFA